MSKDEISKVDIVICTWCRAGLLGQTLESIRNIRIPAGINLRVVIVDNNSTDQTAKVVEAFESEASQKSIEVLSLIETRQGHTFSRNAAVEAISSSPSDLMLWTDDDVIVAEDWVEKYVEAVESNPEVSFFGSVIEPRFEEIAGGRAKWIEQNWESLKGCFAHRDLGDEPIEFTKSRLPYGANFAIRTEVQLEYRFDSQLGRRGNEVHGEDELDLFRRMLDDCHHGRWVQGAVVEHIIPADRQTESYVYDYFIGQGKSLVAKGEAWSDDVNKLSKEMKWEYFMYKLKRYFCASPTWVGHLIRSALAKGQVEASSNA